MRRSITAVACSAAVAVTTIALAPAAGALRVDGNHLSDAGLTKVIQDCDMPGMDPSTGASFFLRRLGDAPSGSHAAGWRPDGAGSATGVATTVPDPASIDRLSIQVRRSAESVAGIAVITFRAAGDDGTWRGFSAFGTDSTPGWHLVRAEGRIFEWRHFSSTGELDQNGAPATIADFVAKVGGAEGGAQVGFAYGCDGNPFYIDDFRVAGGGADRDYDFEGYNVRVALSTAGAVRKTLTVVYGEKVRMVGRITEANEGDPIRGVNLTLQSRRLSHTSYRKLTSRVTGSDGKASAIQALPTFSSDYRLAYRGNDRLEAGASQIRILVRPNVSARFADQTVPQGSRFVINGRVLPQRAAALSLQKFVHGRWKTMRKGRSTRSGHYSIGAQSNQVGRSFWRVRVAPGGGNIEGKTIWLRLKTTDRPGGGSPTPTNPPPPPPNEPPPPPPPPGPQR